MRFNHFVDAAIYNHVQTHRNNACVDKQLKPEQLKESIAMYNYGQHLSNSQLPYSGKFLKGLIFKNFKNSQAFLKIFFRNQ